MEIVLQYFEGCPNWKIAHERLVRLCAERPDISLSTQLVESDAQAQRLGFHGSPSVLIDGFDRFSEASSAVGLSCRRYMTPEGIAGAPTMEQLRSAAAAAESTPR
ncbi:thioredoxin family protein [Nesterenkonia sp. MY13]|uniref:Thioredoxin family protein n=2 Tax=Nesterenkonia TaxID=57494 RepID=A0A7X8TJA3_9MICC|nr:MULTISPECIES: thioredoxin family protein [Micrococcaceae]NLS09830.1 thioredoxin family protein [Nesterenkonia sedimenti]WBL20290.1 thioredoxin family protein [Citricoccus sp. NR2]GGE79017.1 hypothetical protein GCM10011401_27910 [Nesterenkonia cremea]